MDVVDFYQREVKTLSPDDRAELARLILDGLSNRPDIDESDEWAEEDLADFAQNTWERAEKLLKETSDD